MNRETLDEIDRILKGKTWLEWAKEFLFTCLIIGGLYKVISVVAQWLIGK